MTDRELFESALKQLEYVIIAHEQVQMDTPEDKALHARACATFRYALETLRGRAQSS